MKKVGHLLAGKLLPFGRISTSFGSCMSESHRVPCTSGCPCSVRGGLFPMEASSLAFACLTQPGLPWPPVMPTVGGSLTHTSPPCGAGTHRPACAGPLRAGFAAPSTAVPVRPLPPPPGLAAVPQAPPPPASGAAPRTGLQVRTPAGGSWLEWAVEWVGPCRPQGGGGGGGAAGTRQKAPPAQHPPAAGWRSRAQLCGAEGPGVGLGPTAEMASGPQPSKSPWSQGPHVLSCSDLMATAAWPWALDGQRVSN